jgi:hypothetical protein
MKYLKESLTRNSFLRLRQQKAGGKKGLERTSALMCFLAFDALLKRTGITPPLDLDPEDSNGKNNRDIFTREFARLVQIKTLGTEIYHVLNLGEVACGGPSPEARFSANFLTVPVKGATTSSESYVYPNRPKNPIIVLGPKATGLVWGIDRHPDWQENLPVFLQDRRTNTPFHDLACFVLRQRGFISSAVSFQDGLMDGLLEIFTEELCRFWRMRLALEKVYVSEIQDPFQETSPNPFADHSWVGNTEQTDHTVALKSRINYLEGLLSVHHIEFDK